MNAQKIEGGVVHEARPRAKGSLGWIVLRCNGQAVRGYVYVDDAVTCKRCLKGARDA